MYDKMQHTKQSDNINLPICGIGHDLGVDENTYIGGQSSEIAQLSALQKHVFIQY